MKDTNPLVTRAINGVGETTPREIEKTCPRSAIHRSPQRTTECKHHRCPMGKSVKDDVTKVNHEDEKSRQELVAFLKSLFNESNLPEELGDWNEESVRRNYQQIQDWITRQVLEKTSIPKNLAYLIPALLRPGDCGRCPLEKPDWLDMEKFRRGQKFAMDNFFGLCFANMVSLCLLFSDEDGLKPMTFTGQSHTPYLAFKRYLSTIQRVRTWYTEDPWAEGSSAHRTMQAVRRMHLSVRKRLCETSREEINAASNISNAWCPMRDLFLEDVRSACPALRDPFQPLREASFRPKGMNQADMSATQFAFMGAVVTYPEAFGVHHSTEEDMDAFCHCWRGLGYLLGIEDEYNFCNGSLDCIRERSRELVQNVFKSKLLDARPEWEHMTRCMVEGTSYYFHCPDYPMVILYMTDLLGIPMPRLRAAISYVTRFRLLVTKWMMYYVMKIPGVPPRLNAMVNQAVDNAVKFSPKKHLHLQKRSAKTLLDISVV